MKHDEIWHLLPWFVNGRLQTDTHEGIDAHLATCANCRAEVELQTHVRDAIAHEDSRQTSAQDSFDQLWEKISERDGIPDRDAPTGEAAGAALIAPGQRKPLWQRPQSPAFRWLLAAVVVEAVGLVTLATVSIQSSRGPAPALYQTLSSPAFHARGGSIRAVFASDLTLRELQGLLSHSQLRIVDGPTDAGVYTLSLDDSHRSVETTLADLRGNVSVRFAEPIGGGAPVRP